MSIQEFVSNVLEQKASHLTEVSNQIWEYAETKYEESKSAEESAQFLEKEGFTVTREAGGIPTAIVAEAGSGSGPIIGIMGEYDALPNLSQKEGLTEQAPISQGAPGHGCGHNLLGTASMAAAVAAKEYIETEGIDATIRYYGCPAEEGGGGKGHMAKAGLFDDVDVALCWHPGDRNSISYSGSLATVQVYYKFHGASSHAAAAPHLGRSALDAVTLMNTGVNFLREHVIQEARLHYAVTNTGGNAPNVVQNEAEVLMKIRAPENKQVLEIWKRVDKIAEGAALMTETTFETEFDSASASMVPNKTLSEMLYKNFKAFGLPDYTEEEKAFAKEIQKTFPESQDEPFQSYIEPVPDEPEPGRGSTDVGDISWVVPTSQIRAVTVAKGTPGHSWQLTSQGKLSVAHKGMLLAGKVLGATAIDLILDPEKVAEAKKEFKKRVDEVEFVRLFPDDAKPQPHRK
jgi:aminobenzoyl-glutamate utilization protein B